MQKLATSALAILLFAGCKKKEEQNTKPDKPAATLDFKYLPVKDVVWKIHTQGEVNEDWGKLDTAVYHYHTIQSTGYDTIIANLRYYKYKIESRVEYQNPPIVVSELSNYMYLREDTVRQRIYAWGNPEIIIVDFAQEQIGEDADVPQQWPQSFVSDIDSLVIASQHLRSWSVSYKYDANKKYFYKAYGIGRQTGVLPFITLGSQPISLDFIYKNETLHFDFEFHK